VTPRRELAPFVAIFSVVRRLKCSSTSRSQNGLAKESRIMTYRILLVLAALAAIPLFTNHSSRVQARAATPVQTLGEAGSFGTGSGGNTGTGGGITGVGGTESGGTTGSGGLGSGGSLGLSRVSRSIDGFGNMSGGPTS
jgi:hypothetical protein